MQNFSTTQASNYASTIGFVVLILNHFHVNIASGEVTLLVGGIMAAGGVLVNWYHRYSQGDLTKLGFRLESK